MRLTNGIAMITLFAWLQVPNSSYAQCTDYDIIVGGGAAEGEMHWELMDQFGNIVASGDAPETTGECLDDGCYTMVMYDDGGNGWQGGTWSINLENTSIVVASGTLSSGGYGTALVDLNGDCGAGGCQDYLIDVTAGSNPNDVYWELVDEFGALITAGGAPESQVVCLVDGCYTLYLYDAGGDGWEGGGLYDHGPVQQQRHQPGHARKRRIRLQPDHHRQRLWRMRLLRSGSDRRKRAGRCELGPV